MNPGIGPHEANICLKVKVAISKQESCQNKPEEPIKNVKNRFSAVEFVFWSGW